MGKGRIPDTAGSISKYDKKPASGKLALLFPARRGPSETDVDRPEAFETEDVLGASQVLKYESTSALGKILSTGSMGLERLSLRFEKLIRVVE